MITALGTNAVVAVDFLGIRRLAAVRAFDPDAVRNDLLLEDPDERVAFFAKKAHEDLRSSRLRLHTADRNRLQFIKRKP